MNTVAEWEQSITHDHLDKRLEVSQPRTELTKSVSQPHGPELESQDPSAQQTAQIEEGDGQTPREKLNAFRTPPMCFKISRPLSCLHASLALRGTPTTQKALSDPKLAMP